MKYEQLSDEAKAKAREWWKELEGQCWGSDRAPDYYEDMATCLSHLGIEVGTETERWRTRDGKQHSRQRLAFQWSGFWSQGDGLVVEGRWRAENVDLDKLREHAPQDETLAAICIEMTVLKLRWPTLTAKITTVSHGPGLPGMSLEDVFTGQEDEDGTPGWPGEQDTKTLKRLIERACKWCYDQLEANYEYDTSDEAAAEAIEANEYEFDEEGALGVGAHA